MAWSASVLWFFDKTTVIQCHFLPLSPIDPLSPGSAAREQTIQVFQTGAAAGDQLIKQLSLVLETPHSLHFHCEPLVEPARYRPAGGRAPNQDVSDFMAQHIFQSVVGIARRTSRKHDD